MNPFSQGWSNAPLFSNNALGRTPSIHGVVPSYPLGSGQPPAGSNLIRFTFVPSGSDSSILNSLVTGSRGQTYSYFRITTNSTAHGYSVVQNSRFQNRGVHGGGSAPYHYGQLSIFDSLGMACEQRVGRWRGGVDSRRSQRAQGVDRVAAAVGGQRAAGGGRAGGGGGGGGRERASSGSQRAGGAAAAAVGGQRAAGSGQAAGGQRRKQMQPAGSVAMEGTATMGGEQGWVR
ncbi:hypothetical protein GGX14DRAFT_391093 [Mycena pura]|uniref:Uncharacterized protein n=1 Tax=Mycena pura TaxID=153505 RepID=A0AAD6VRE2_9AGAR|nr:hypothetical protein GGX14DRAFT_391093 [Mycena pura]